MCRSGRNARRRAPRCGGRARAEPAERRRMAVEHGDDAAIARQRRQQILDMAEILRAAVVAAQFPRRGPARMQPVGRGDRQQANVATAFADQADGLDRLRRHRAGIGDHDFAVRPGLAQPVGAVGDILLADPASSSAAAVRWCASRAANRPNRRSRTPSPPRSRCMWRKPQPMIAASSSTKAGSNEARPSCAMPIKGVRSTDARRLRARA